MCSKKCTGHSTKEAVSEPNSNLQCNFSPVKKDLKNEKIKDKRIKFESHKLRGPKHSA